MSIDQKFILGDQLTSKQRAFFNEFGFIHFQHVLNRNEIDQMIAAVQDLERAWIEEDVTKVNGIPIKYGKDETGNRIVQRFAFASMHSEILHRYLQDKRLQVLKGFLPKESRIVENEKDGLVINHYVNTGESNYTKLGWHTDCLRDIFQGFHIDPMLNIGTSLDDSPKEKGGLRVIPGSHKQGAFDLLFRKRYFVDNNPDKNEFILETDAGDITVHHGRLWHRVALSQLTGAESRRRVMYFPIISGKYKPKTENSKTPIYHKFQHVVK